MAKKKNLDINNIGAIMQQMVVNFDHINKGLESVANRFVNFSKQIQTNAIKTEKDNKKSDNIFLEALKQKTGAVGTFVTKIEGLIKSFKDQSTATIIAAVSLGALSLAVTVVSALYNRFIDIQKQYASAMGTASMATGGSAAQMTAFRRNIDELRPAMSNLTDDITGISIAAEEQTNTLLAMHEAATRMTFGPGSLGESLVSVARGFGIGADAAAGMFRMVTQGARDPNAAFQAWAADVTNFADSIGVSAGQVAKDMNDSRPTFAQFGRDVVNVFKDAEIEANQFGYSAQKIFDMMKGFDTFSGAADNVNKLNAMFGTSLNSLELMEEQNPAKRLEMIRSQLRGAGFDFNHMSRQQVQMLSQVTGESAEVIQRVFGDGQSLAQLQQQQARAAAEQLHQQKQQVSNQMMMNDLLGRTTNVFKTIDRLFGQLFNDLSQDLAPAFDEIHSIAIELTQEFSQWVRKVTQTPEFHDAIKDMAKWIRESAEWLKKHLPTWEQIKNVVEKVGPILGTIWDGIAAISNALGPEGTLIVGLGILAAFTFAGPISGIVSMTAGLATMNPMVIGLGVALAALAATYLRAKSVVDAGDEERRKRHQGTTFERSAQAQFEGETAVEELERRQHQMSLGQTQLALQGYNNTGGVVAGQLQSQRRIQEFAGGITDQQENIMGSSLDAVIHTAASDPNAGTTAGFGRHLRSMAPDAVRAFEQAHHQRLEDYYENVRAHNDIFTNPAEAITAPATSAINTAPVVAPTAQANITANNQVQHVTINVPLNIDHKEIGNAVAQIAIGAHT